MRFYHRNRRRQTQRCKKPTPSHAMSGLEYTFMSTPYETVHGIARREEVNRWSAFFAIQSHAEQSEFECYYASQFGQTASICTKNLHLFEHILSGRQANSHWIAYSLRPPSFCPFILNRLWIMQERNEKNRNYFNCDIISITVIYIFLYSFIVDSSLALWMMKNEVKWDLNYINSVDLTLFYSVEHNVFLFSF